jgi:hypothetical protein
VEKRTRPLDLSSLLSPLPVREFLTDYWATRPLFLKGSAAKFADFFDRSRFDRAVATRNAKGQLPKVKAVFNAARKEAGKIPQVSLGGADIRGAYAAGATVCVTSIHEHDASLAHFVDSIRAELGYPGEAVCNSYLSPHGCGFGMHFDARIACTLQLEGSKWWTFSNTAAVDWPLGNADYGEGGDAHYFEEADAGEGGWADARKFAANEFTEVLLEPGDFLVLPAGMWHSARAEGHSLAINLAFEPLDMATLIAAALRKRFEADPLWRAVPPAGQGQQKAADTYLAERLREALGFLGSIDADAEIPRRAWGQLVMKSSVERPRARAPGPAAGKIAPSQRLRIPQGSAVYLQEMASGRVLALHVDDCSVEMGGASAALLREIFARRVFVAQDAAGWTSEGPLPWESVRELLATLVAEGALETAED